MEQFIGDWTFSSSTNIQDFVNALGLDDEMQAVAQVVKPNLTISQEGNTFSINLVSSVFSDKFSFRLGEVFQQKTVDGRDCTVVVSLKGDKLIQVSKWNGSQSSSTYEINDGQLIKTFTHQNVVAVWTFDKA